MRESVWKLRDWIENSSNVVIIAGGGVTAESGVQVFRGDEGLDSSKEKFGRYFEEVLNVDMLNNNPSEFYAFYREKVLLPYMNAQPNSVHYMIKKLEEIGKLGGVITTNIDSLFQAAEVVRVLELNGSYKENYCQNCEKAYTYLDVVGDYGGVPRCSVCDGLVRPKIVLYGEEISAVKMRAAKVMIERADTLIVAGTSLVVYPAASLVQHHKGDHLVLAHTDNSAYDKIANLSIEGALSKTLAEAIRHVRSPILDETDKN